MANALTEVTGISARLNWPEVGGFAEELVRNGYTAEQIRDHYGGRKRAGKWHWYESDWRGKRGDKPRVKEIRETIAGAVALPADNKEENDSQSWIEHSIRLARLGGLLPNT